MSVHMNKKANGEQENKTTSWQDINHVHKWVASRNGMALYATLCFPISEDKSIVVLTNWENEKRLEICHYEERR